MTWKKTVFNLHYKGLDLVAHIDKDFTVWPHIESLYLKNENITLITDEQVFSDLQEMIEQELAFVSP